MADISKVNLGGTIYNIKDVIARQNGGTGGGGDVTKEMFDSLAIAVSILQGSAVDGLGDNIVVETFDDPETFYIVHGQYDSSTCEIFA